MSQLKISAATDLLGNLLAQLKEWASYGFLSRPLETQPFCCLTDVSIGHNSSSKSDEFNSWSYLLISVRTGKLKNDRVQEAAFGVF